MKKSLHKYIKRILCLLLVFCLSSSANIALAVSKETQDEINRVKREKARAEEEKKETEQEQKEINNAKSSVESYLADLKQQSKSLKEQISILNEDIGKKEEEIQAKEEEIAKMQAQLEQQYADMKLRIQYMYENSQDMMVNYMSAALTGGIPDLLNQVEYAVNINSYDRNMLESYKETKAQLEDQEAELLEEQEALGLLKAEVEKKQEQVASQEKAAGSKLSDYDEMIRQMEGELGSMEELIEEKTKLLNQLIAKAEQEERQARIEAAKQAASSMNGGSITAGDSQINHHVVGLSDYELMLLATMIYCEAGNQGWEGQTAVGYVIMNRVRSSLFPNSLEAVLRQSRQFEPVGSGRFDLVLKAEQDPDIRNIVTQSCWDAARTVVNGSSNVGDSLFFRTWAPVPSLVENLKNGGVPYWIIKDHIFYYYWTSYSGPGGGKPTVPNEPDDDEDDEDEDEDDDDKIEEPDTSNPPEEPDEPETPSGGEETPDEDNEGSDSSNGDGEANPPSEGNTQPPSDANEEDQPSAGGEENNSDTTEDDKDQNSGDNVSQSEPSNEGQSEPEASE